MIKVTTCIVMSSVVAFSNDDVIYRLLANNFFLYSGQNGADSLMGKGGDGDSTPNGNT